MADGAVVPGVPPAQGQLGQAAGGRAEPESRGLAGGEASAPTFALEPVGGGGEQKSVGHGLRATAAGDAGLLVPRLHPLRQPAQAAVTVQRVGAQRPGGRAGSQSPPTQLGPLGEQSLRALARLGVSGMSTSGLQAVPPTPGDVSTPTSPSASEALFSPTPVR